MFTLVCIDTYIILKHILYTHWPRYYENLYNLMHYNTLLVQQLCSYNSERHVYFQGHSGGVVLDY